MKALLLSYSVEKSHEEALKDLLGKGKASKALFVIAATVPYGLEPRPDWVSRSLGEIEPFAEDITEVTLEDDVPTDLSGYDLVFVSGGNVLYLAYKLAETGFGEMLKKYIERGGVYVGNSAGSIVLMESIEHFLEADGMGGAPGIYPGLGIVDYAIIPHMNHPKYGPIVERAMQKYESEGKKVYPINDDQALLIDGSATNLI